MGCLHCDRWVWSGAWCSRPSQPSQPGNKFSWVAADHRQGHNPMMRWPCRTNGKTNQHEKDWTDFFPDEKLEFNCGLCSTCVCSGAGMSNFCQVSTWTRWKKSCRCRFLGVTWKVISRFQQSESQLSAGFQHWCAEMFQNKTDTSWKLWCIKGAIHLFEDVLSKCESHQISTNAISIYTSLKTI